MQDASWSTWFCDLKGNDILVHINEEFINDDFNLTGLNQIIPKYKDVLSMIRDTDTDLDSEDYQELNKYATSLYYLIHQRYIISKKGLADMADRFNAGDFGKCPRFLCNQSNLLPIGLHESLGKSSVKLFCPKCQEVYYPSSKYAKIDGAAFGPSFPSLLLLSVQNLKLNTGPLLKYVPRIFGIKVHQSVFMPENEVENEKGGSAMQQ